MMDDKKEPKDNEAIDLFKEEMELDDLQSKVNTVHRLKSILLAIGPKAANDTMIPYFETLVKKEDDEVLYAIAEEFGKVWQLFLDKNSLIPILEYLCAADETVVREQSVRSIIEICKAMTDNEIQSTIAPITLKLSQSDWFTGRVSSCSLILTLYPQVGPHKEKLRKYTVI